MDRSDVFASVTLGSVTRIFAHRGASAAAGDNTIRAFELAASMGADGVELDVRRTADSELAVHHDPVLADGRAIADVEAADLPGHVVLLDAALDACGDLVVNVEIKNAPDEPGFCDGPDLAIQVGEALASRGTDDRWIVSSFDLATVGEVRSRFPEFRTALLAETLAAEEIDRALGAGFGCLNPGERSVTKAALDAAHRSGLEVWPWTVDDPARLAELIEWGVDGLFTNYPDRALRLRDESDRPGTPT